MQTMKFQYVSLGMIMRKFSGDSQKVVLESIIFDVISQIVWFLS